MSHWDERIRGHRVWGLLDSVGPLIDKALGGTSLSIEIIDSLERIRTILGICGKRLASADAILIHPSVVENIAALLESIKSNLVDFTSSWTVNHINSADVYADNLLQQITSIPNVTTVDELTFLSEAATSYRATLEDQLRRGIEAQKELNARAADNQTRLASISETLTAEQQRLTALINDYQSQFSTAQDKRASDFSAVQNDQLSKFTNIFTELQAQFSSDQNTRNTEFSEALRSSTEKLTAFMTSAATQLSNQEKQFSEALIINSKGHEDRLEELQESYANRASEMLSSMEKHKSDIESLVGVIGNLGVTSGYQKAANHAKTMLYFWQGVTSLALAGLIFVAVITAFPSLSEKLLGIDKRIESAVVITQVQKPAAENGVEKATGSTKAETGAIVSSTPEPASVMTFYHGLATRIFLALTFGIFAGYSGRQASHFLATETRNRKLALELEALGPFIEPLSLEDRNKFRIQVGERSFGGPNGGGEKRKESDPVTVLDLIRSKELRDAFFDFIKKEKGNP